MSRFSSQPTYASKHKIYGERIKLENLKYLFIYRCSNPNSIII